MGATQHPRGAMGGRKHLAAFLAAGLLALLACPAGAPAQDFALRQFAPAPHPDAIVQVRSARALPHLSMFGSLVLDYAREELVLASGGRAVARPIADRFTGELGLAFGLLDRLDVSASLPIHLAQRAIDEAGRDSWSSGLGDMRLGLKATLLDHRTGRGFGLAVAAEVLLPTGRLGHGMSEPGARLTPALIADWRHPSGVVIAIDVGYRLRRAFTVHDLRVDDEIRLAAGTEIPIGLDGMSLVGEVAAGIGLAKDGGRRFTARQVPVEGIGGVRTRFAGGWILTVGTGLNMTRGYGMPGLRVFAGIGYAPPAARRASAEDAKDSGPTARDVPVGAPVPPGTGDGGAARPPDPFAAALRDDPDPDGDGVVGADDRCPGLAEDFDGFRDDDGCPDPDNDGDGVPDDEDACRDAAETVNGVDDDDGCPDAGASAVTVQADRIAIGETILFAPGSDVIDARSLPILRQVAAVLKARPGIARVRIEGHTDDRGDREMNVDLSERRARQVRNVLIEAGVAPARLEARGYGPVRPVGDNATAEGRARNRRVEFRVLGPGEGGEEAP